MIKLDNGNVLLKPSQRRQLMSWLKRAMRLGSRIGNFALTITMHRAGRQCEVRATVQDAAGSFVCRSRQHEWRDAMRELIRMLCNGLHEQLLRSVAA